MTQKKEFDRSICFTFYKEWAETVKEIEEEYGVEESYKFLMAIINYALYEEEPEKKGLIKLFFPTLKEKIDASQKNRARGFSREDKEMTAKIIEYKKANPNASYRQIAEALGCGKTKVGDVLKGMDFTDTDTNTFTNTNTTTTTNTSTDTDTDSPLLDTEESQKDNANASEGAKAPQTEDRKLEELSEEELKELQRLIELNDKDKYSYINLKKMFNLKKRVSYDMIKEIDAILADRKKELHKEEIRAEFANTSNENIATLAAFLRCNENEVVDNLCELNVDADYMCRWISEHGECTSTVADSDRYESYRQSQKLDSYFDVVKMMVKNNQLNNNDEMYF